MSTTLTFELSLESDYHVASGHRWGTEIDSALFRDRYGRPVLRGSLVGQLLRDAARELLATGALQKHGYARCAASGGPKEPEYCRQWKPKEAICPICHVFGSPRKPKPWAFSSARLVDSSGVDDLNLWGAEAVTRVRVNPRTRRAAPSQLFNEEVGDGRLVFQFHARWRGSGTPADADIALLAAAARNLRHLGKARRRGRGRCQVRLIEVNGSASQVDWLERFRVDWIDERWKAPGNGITQSQFHLAEEVSPIAADTPMRVQIFARLEEPLIVARRALAGNQYETLEVLPGNVLLGALAERAASGNDLTQQETYRQFVGLFRRGWVHFPFLVPAPDERRRIYPAFAVPLDLFRCKQKATKHGLQSFALDASSSIHCRICDDEDVEENALEQISGLQILRSGLEEATVHQREEMHVSISPETKRAQDRELFSYVALDTGQHLYGELICASADVWEKLCEMTGLPKEGGETTLRLGKASNRGYGQVTLYLTPLASFTSHNSLLAPLQERLPDPHTPFTLLLTSDTIITDPWGRYPNAFEECWLSNVLGLPVSMKRSFARTRVVDGFHGYIGLPRWRDQALVAGSVVGLEINDSTLSREAIWQTLEKVEREGIGLRRNEGYGQIVVNHPVYRCVDGAIETINLRLPSFSIDRSGTGTDPVSSAEQFKWEWEREIKQVIEEDADLWKEPIFTSVARVMRSGSTLQISDLLEQLSQFEAKHPTLDPLPGEPMVVEDQEYPVKRARKEPLAEERAQAGYQQIQKLLKQLGEETEDPLLRAQGVRMLATQVAERARSARNRR